MRLTRCNTTRFLSAALVVSAIGFAGSAVASPLLYVVSDNTAPPAGVRGIGTFPSVPTGSPDATTGGMSIGVTEGTPGALPVGTQGYASSYLWLSDPVNAFDNVTFTFLGDGDASFNNVFRVNNADVFALNTTAFGTSQTFSMPTNQLISFSYRTGAATPLTISNDGTSNTYSASGPDFWIGGLPGTNQGTLAMLGLSDAGATGDNCGGTAADCDFQDMHVNVTVPEPGSIFLVALGLLGLGLVFGSSGRQKAYAA